MAEVVRTVVLDFYDDGTSAAVTTGDWSEDDYADFLIVSFDQVPEEFMPTVLGKLRAKLFSLLTGK